MGTPSHRERERRDRELDQEDEAPVADRQEGAGDRDNTYGEDDTFAQPFDDAPAADSQNGQFYAPDDPTAPQSYAPADGSPENGDVQNTGSADGYSEEDFTGDGTIFILRLVEPAGRGVPPVAP